MLIVNADDWGMEAGVTASIFECFRSGRITSASAMVYMADSDRAAAIARDEPLPLGLHLNFAEHFSADSVPRPVRDRQRRLVDFARGAVHRKWLYQPWLRQEVARAIRDQLDRFEELYGQPPIHVDGHQHFHIWPTVLLARALPEATPVRLPFTFTRQEKPWPNRAIRAGLAHLIRRRHPAADHFVTLGRLETFADSTVTSSRLERSRRQNVEVMVHPGRPEEYEFLMSSAWAEVMATYAVGTARELSSPSGVK